MYITVYAGAQKNVQVGKQFVNHLYPGAGSSNMTPAEIWMEMEKRYVGLWFSVDLLRAPNPTWYKLCAPIKSNVLCHPNTLFYIIGLN